MFRAILEDDDDMTGASSVTETETETEDETVTEVFDTSKGKKGLSSSGIKGSNILLFII